MIVAELFSCMVIPLLEYLGVCTIRVTVLLEYLNSTFFKIMKHIMASILFMEMTYKKFVGLTIVVVMQFIWLTAIGF